MIGKSFDESPRSSGYEQNFERGAYYDERRPERPETFAREMDYIKPSQVGQDVQPDGINLQLVKLRDKVNILHEVFSNLEQKTSSICKPMPCKAGCEKDRPDMGSEVQRFLKDQNDRLDALLDRIAFMCDSIDL